MRRAVIALAVVAGTAVPALVASVWLFGCCVLPFHAVMHRMLPLCRLSQATQDTAPHHEPATAPAAKQDRLTYRAVVPFAEVANPTIHRESLVCSSSAAYRSFITLGAARCDRDVGLHTLLVTFLI